MGVTKRALPPERVWFDFAVAPNSRINGEEINENRPNNNRNKKKIHIKKLKINLKIRGKKEKFKHFKLLLLESVKILIKLIMKKKSIV